ncbi:hypothetical protein VPH35_038679 [Triticum aestivum]
MALQPRARLRRNTQAGGRPLVFVLPAMRYGARRRPSVLQRSNASTAAGCDATTRPRPSCCVGTVVGAAMQPRRLLVLQSSAAELQWSARGDWSSATAIMELRRGCNGASTELQWSTAAAIMELRRRHGRCIAAPAASRALHRTSSGINEHCIAPPAASRPLHRSSGGLDDRCIAAPRAPMQCSPSLQVLHLSARRRLPVLRCSARCRSRYCISALAGG